MATTRASRIRYLNRFNVDTAANLGRWSDARLEQAVLFVKAEVERAQVSRAR